MNKKEKIETRLLISVLSVSLLILCGLLTETAVNIAFPTLMTEFKINATTVQWLTTGKMLVVAMITPLSSFFKKRFKIKNLFLFSGAIFLIGNVIGAAAFNFPMLIFSCVVQGVGIGLVLPLVFNIILEQAPASKIGTVMGIASLVIAAGPALGPTFGGIVVSFLSWRAIFIIMIPLTLLSLVGGALTIAQKSETEKIPLDLLGTILVMVGFFFLVYGSVNIGSFSEKSGTVIFSFMIGVLAILAFILFERKCQNPLVQLNIFQNARFNWHLAAYFSMQITFLGFSFILSNYLQIVCGKSSFVTGMCLLPGALGQAVLSICGGMILDKYGAKKPIIWGSVLAIIGSGLFWVSGLYMGVAMVVMFYIIMEVGLGCTYGNTMTNALKSIPKDCHADGNAVYNTLSQFSGSLGTSITAVILAFSQSTNSNSDYLRNTAQGAHNAFTLFFILLIFNFIFQMVALCKSVDIKDIKVN